MIGFSIEFKRWYFVLRGPKGRVYLATGFAKRMPVMTPQVPTHLTSALAHGLVMRPMKNFLTR
jgi:hypothetical protein